MGVELEKSSSRQCHKFSGDCAERFESYWSKVLLHLSQFKSVSKSDKVAHVLSEIHGQAWDYVESQIFSIKSMEQLGQLLRGEFAYRSSHYVKFLN